MRVITSATAAAGRVAIPLHAHADETGNLDRVDDQHRDSIKIRGRKGNP
jgi:hypothetical protein